MSEQATDENKLSERVALLREAFDRSFAEDPVDMRAALQNYLSIRCNGDPYAVDLRQIGGLHEGKQIRPLPSPLPQLLGIAGFRGALVPVYDLSLLLGYTRRSKYAPRWMMLVEAANSSFALSFDELEGYLQLSIENLSSANGMSSARPHVQAAIPGDSGARALLDIPSLSRAINALAEVLPKKE